METNRKTEAQAGEREALALVIAWQTRPNDAPLPSEYAAADAVLAAGFRRSPGSDLLAEVWDEGWEAGYANRLSAGFPASRDPNPYRASDAVDADRG